MAKTDWTMSDTVMPEDMNQIGQEINDLAEDVGDMSTVPTTAKDAAGAIAELFTSVSNGKSQVAAAITDKGVPTSPTDTFATMAANIEAIPVGPDTSDATVAAGDLRAGKVAYGKDGARIVGTVPVQSGGNVVPGPNDIVKAAGIYDTPITVKGVAVDPSKVLAGTTIAGTPGTMPDRGAVNQTISTQNGEYTIPVGYHNGSGKVKATFANLTPGNVKKDVNIGGVTGELEPRQFASGNVTSGASQNFYSIDYINYPLPAVIVSGLNFKPVLIYLISNDGAFVNTSLYTEHSDGLFATFTVKVISKFGRQSETGVITYNLRGNEGAAYVNASGFCLPVLYGGRSYTWYAYG